MTIVARTRDILERTSAEIAAATGVKVTVVAGDITTKEGRSAALAACPAPDILLNNSGGIDASNTFATIHGDVPNLDAALDEVVRRDWRPGGVRREIPCRAVRRVGAYLTISR